MKSALFLFAVSAFGQTGGALQPVPIQQPLDNAGRTLQGQCLYTYAAGTTTPQTTYSNSALSVPNTNPIVLNGFGREPAVYLSAVSYKIVLAYASLGTCPVSPGTVIWSQDNVYDFGELLKVTLNGSGGAAQIGFQQAGGSLITVGGAIGSVGIYDLGYSSLSTGCAAATAAPFLISKAWLAVTTQTLNCNVNFIPGGTIQPASSQVVTFSKFPLCPGLQQCFDASVGGAGSILFPQAGPTFPSQVEWFGAVPQITSGALNGGAINSAAFAAAQRALPVFGTNPNMVTMNLGTIKIANTGINYAYPLSSTFHLSPFTTIAGDDTQTSYLATDHSSFTGTFLIDTINANGTGQTFNDNFNNGIRNLNISTINSTATYIVGGINWGASLNSKIQNVTIGTSGIGISVGQTDGTSIENTTVNVFGAAGQSALTGQCLTVENGNAQQFNNTAKNLECKYVGVNGSPPLEPGFLPSSGTYGISLGDNVQGFNFDVANSENFPSAMYIGAGSHDITVNNMNAYVDCIFPNNCTVPNYCAFLLEPNTWNIRLAATVIGFKYALCVGHKWAPSVTYDTNQNFVIDPHGCVEHVTTGGTTGTTQPAWATTSVFNGSGCSGTTTDNTVVWTSTGAITQICDPSTFGENVTFDPQGFQVNCTIPTVNRTATNGSTGRLTLTGPAGQSIISDNTQYPILYDSGTFWQTPPNLFPGSVVIGTLIAANFNSTADQVVHLHFPPGVTEMTIDTVYGWNFSKDLGTAQGGMYQSVGKANCTIVPAGQFWGTQASMTATFYVSANVAGGTCANFGNSGVGNTYGKVPIQVANQDIYLSLTTPEGSAATGNITVYGRPLVAH